MNHRIAIVTSLHPHNDVRIYQKLAKTLAYLGWRVEIINPFFEGSDDNQIKFRKINLSSNRIIRLSVLRKRVLAEVLTSRADIFVFCDPELLPIISELSGSQIITIYDAHEDLPLQIKNKPYIPAIANNVASLMADSFLKRHIANANGVIAATEKIAQRLKEYNNNVLVLKNYPTESEYALFEKGKLENKKQKKTFCYAGLISKRRGLFTMIKACHEVGATLILAGEFESQAHRREAERMPEYSCVKYVGKLNREGVARVYGQAQAGLLLLEKREAYSQSLPIKMLEYLGAGLPVVATNFPYWQELGFKNIIFTDPDNKADVIGALNLLEETSFDQQQAKQLFKTHCFDNYKVAINKFFSTLENEVEK